MKPGIYYDEYSLRMLEVKNYTINKGRVWIELDNGAVGALEKPVVEYLLKNLKFLGEV